MVCYAVMDTNVLVSALISSNTQAAAVQVVDRLLDGEITPVYSVDIMNEYRDVLFRSKFKLSYARVDYLLSAIEKYGVIVEPMATGAVLPDMNDLPFYEVVMEKRSDNDYLVTDNLKHFPKETFIVTARQMIEILDGNK